MKRFIAAIIMTSYLAACTAWGVSPSERVRVAFLATELQLVEGKQLDASKTALAVIGLGAVIGLVVALSNIQTTDPNH